MLELFLNINIWPLASYALFSQIHMHLLIHTYSLIFSILTMSLKEDDFWNICCLSTVIAFLIESSDKNSKDETQEDHFNCKAMKINTYIHEPELSQVLLEFKARSEIRADMDNRNVNKFGLKMNICWYAFTYFFYVKFYCLREYFFDVCLWHLSR